MGVTGMLGMHNLSSEAGMINRIQGNGFQVQKLQTNLETQRSLYRNASLGVAVNVTDTVAAEIRRIKEPDMDARLLLREFHSSFTQPESLAVNTESLSVFQVRGEAEQPALHEVPPARGRRARARHGDRVLTAVSIPLDVQSGMQLLD